MATVTETTENAEKSDGSNESPSYVIRYGQMRTLGVFTCRRNETYQRGQEVIIRTKRGNEWGIILCPANARSLEFLDETDPAGRIQRAPNVDDYARRDVLIDLEKTQYTACAEEVESLKLQMNLIDVEHLFGGERSVFYYVAEKRVDFRELVKRLANRLKVRVEMRQIGVRDEAKLLADYGDCGKPVCCGTHLKQMPPVSMKMAKMQKASLDPNKISGRCGRLKCCLRYEYDTYEEYRKELPRVGSLVVTKQGRGKVTGQEILARQIFVHFEDDRRMLIPQDDVLTVMNGGRRKKSNEKQGSKEAAE